MEFMRAFAGESEEDHEISMHEPTELHVPCMCLIITANLFWAVCHTYCIGYFMWVMAQDGGLCEPLLAWQPNEAHPTGSLMTWRSFTQCLL